MFLIVMSHKVRGSRNTEKESRYLVTKMSNKHLLSSVFHLVGCGKIGCWFAVSREKARQSIKNMCHYSTIP